MKTKYLIFITVLMASCFFYTPVMAAKWYDGGTLHSKNVKEWNSSTYANRLATSADWFTSITTSHNKSLKSKLDKLSLKTYLSQLKFFSIQLEKCVSNLTQEKGIYNNKDKAAEVATACYLAIYGTD